MHPKGPDAGQGDRPGVGVADPDRGLGALGVLVADPERTCPVRALLPEPGVPDLLPGTLALARVQPRPQRLADINGGLLEHLLDHLPAPGQARHHHINVTVGVDDEPAARGLGLLPRVERVDEVETGPRHLHRAAISLAVAPGGAGVQVQAQGLVRGEPCRPDVPGEHAGLLDARVEAVAERRVAGHHRPCWQVPLTPPLTCNLTWVAGAIITAMTTHVTSRGRYPSDLSDTAWARIAAFVVPAHPKGGRPCPAGRWREYMDAMGYVARTGCPWRALPHDFTVTWSATHKRFLVWTRSGLWSRLLRVLREEARQHTGRPRRPTGAVVDSSSVKGTPVAGPRGFDGATKAGVELEIVSGPKPVGGFIVQPRRWVVERTNGWINHHRRLVRQYETTTTAHEGFLILSQIGLLLRRLNQGQ